jgi:hypothetical protein
VQVEAKEGSKQIKSGKKVITKSLKLKSQLQPSIVDVRTESDVPIPVELAAASPKT